MQNKVADIILKSLNRNFLTKIETESYRFSLLKKFPRATIELRNVLVHSSPDFDRSGFGNINTDTLLAAKSASVDFKMTDILKGDYTFRSISIKSGILNLFTDSARKNNYDVSAGNGEKNEEGSSALNLNRINLEDVMVSYHDLDAELIIKSMFRESRIKSRISGSDIDFESNSKVVFELFQLRNFLIRQPVAASLEVGLNKNNKGVFFKKSSLSIENWDFILTGYVASDNFLDLDIKGNNIDISKIVNYFPDKYKNLAMEYHPSGILKIESKVKGVSSAALNPHYEVSWSIKDAHVAYNKSDLMIDRFSFDGSYTNGTKNRPETSTLTISNFTTRLGSADYRGSFKVTDFTRPEAELTFNGILYPSELKEFLNLKYVENAGGTIGIDIRLNGLLERKGKYRFTDLFSLESRSQLNFNSFSICLNNKPVEIREANGIISFNESTSANDFKMIINGQKISLSGKLMNLPEWLSGMPVNLTGTASLSASSILPAKFSPVTSFGENPGGKTRNITGLTLPGDIFLEADFNIDTLVYKTFLARNIKGSLSLKPRMLNISYMDLTSQGGKISGDALLLQNQNRSFIGRGNFTFSGIDVNETFTTFNNFGQDFLKAENIEGSLSGSLSLLMPTDSLLNVDVKSVTAEGKYVLTDGALIDFDPVKELSSFIELSELENIKFDRLENDFFIRTNALYIPLMDVRSSAVDLSVNGKHNFDNNFQYHVRVLLSDILSRKARKSRTVSTQFGEIEDDGLGRTSLFLKIDGNGDDIKVSYDMNAASTRVKEDIRKERQSLKQILNEEYGWYGDEVEGEVEGEGEGEGEDGPEKKQASKPRFRIAWEGSDTLKTEEEPEPEKNENLFENLFRKRR